MDDSLSLVLYTHATIFRFKFNENTYIKNITILFKTVYSD